MNFLRASTNSGLLICTILPSAVGLRRPVRPHVGVAESRRVARAVTEGLPKGGRSLALLGERVELVPGHVELGPVVAFAMPASLNQPIR